MMCLIIYFTVRPNGNNIHYKNLLKYVFGNIVIKIILKIQPMNMYVNYNMHIFKALTLGAYIPK